MNVIQTVAGGVACGVAMYAFLTSSDPLFKSVLFAIAVSTVLVALTTKRS